jgi:hypothetical protein
MYFQTKNTLKNNYYNTLKNSLTFNNLSQEIKVSRHKNLKITKLRLFLNLHFLFPYSFIYIYIYIYIYIFFFLRSAACGAQG